MHPKRRLGLDLSEKVRVKLDELKVRCDADSLSEVVRRALAVFDALLDAQQTEGALVVVRSRDGSERVLVL